MIYCPKYKIKINESFECIHCQFNLPITLNFKVNCRYPIQLVWTNDFKNIIKERGENNG